jgi:hypothetical protein
MAKSLSVHKTFRQSTELAKNSAHTTQSGEKQARKKIKIGAFYKTINFIRIAKSRMSYKNNKSGTLPETMKSGSCLSVCFALNRIEISLDTKRTLDTTASV